MSAEFKQAMDKAKKEAKDSDAAEAERKKNLSTEEQEQELTSGKKTEKKTDQPKLKGAVDKDKEAEDRKKLKDLTKPKFTLD